MIRTGANALGYQDFHALWMDYTVFTLVRNPYDRAGSSYDYLLSRRTVVRCSCNPLLHCQQVGLGVDLKHQVRLALQERNHQCRDPSFAHFLARPYILGLQNLVFSCNEPIHDFYHVEPQHTCLLDDNKELVVDYILRCATAWTPACTSCLYLSACQIALL
jgi:hypothetical protein